MNILCICCCTATFALLVFEVFSGKLSYFSAIWWAFGALMFFMKPQGREGKSERVSLTVNTLRELCTAQYTALCICKHGSMLSQVRLPVN